MQWLYAGGQAGRSLPHGSFADYVQLYPLVDRFLCKTMKNTCWNQIKAKDHEVGLLHYDTLPFLWEKVQHSVIRLVVCRRYADLTERACRSVSTKRPKFPTMAHPGRFLHDVIVYKAFVDSKYLADANYKVQAMSGTLEEFLKAFNRIT